MTIPNTDVSFSVINTELGRGANNQLSFSDSACRTLAGKINGEISLSDFKNKSQIPVLMFTPEYNFSDVGSGKFTNIYGDSIWPAYSSEMGQGWVGTSFIPQVSTAYLTAFCDDIANIYINNSHVADIGMEIKTIQVSLNLGVVNTISVYVDDIPGGERTLELNISKFGNYSSDDGNIILYTNFTWASKPV